MNPAAYTAPAALFTQPGELFGLVLFGPRNFDDLVPCPKGKITSGTILVGGEAVTTELEMTVDSTMGGKKALDMTR